MNPEVLWPFSAVLENGGGGLFSSVALLKGLGGVGLKAFAAGFKGFLPRLGFAPSCPVSMVGIGLQLDQ